MLRLVPMGLTTSNHAADDHVHLIGRVAFAGNHPATTITDGASTKRENAVPYSLLIATSKSACETSNERCSKMPRKIRHRSRSSACFFCMTAAQCSVEVASPLSCYPCEHRYIDFGQKQTFGPLPAMPAAPESAHYLPRVARPLSANGRHAATRGAGGLT
jgi:hypothetical protein